MAPGLVSGRGFTAEVVSGRRLAAGLRGLSIGLALAAAGCGGPSSSPSNGVAKQAPAAIVATSIATAKAARTVHITGTAEVDGSAVDVTADLVAGRGGRIVYAVDGGGVSLLRIGHAAYVKFTGLFRREHETNPALLAQGRWRRSRSRASPTCCGRRTWRGSSTACGRAAGPSCDDDDDRRAAGGAADGAGRVDARRGEHR